jgi:hypothetical protein
MASQAREVMLLEYHVSWIGLSEMFSAYVNGLTKRECPLASFIIYR